MATTAISTESSVRPAAWPGVLLFLGRFALGLIFLIAAYTKLHFNGGWHFGDYHFFFGMAINSYELLPLSAVELLARGLPWFEVVLGVLLIAGVGLRWTGIAASGLLLVFISAMTRAYVKHLEIMCGCFGNNEKLGPLTLLRDSTMLLLAIAVTVGAFILAKKKNTISS